MFEHLKNTNLLENIKSKYFIQNIFQHLHEKTKLQIITYNKSLQQLINIKLFNYRFFSISYIIFEPNGKGKEYFHYKDTLKFDGEYLKGKRNGKGKEYYPNNIIKFEGEYLNGKRNGKGIEYNHDGNLIFEGEFINDLRWNGKGYNSNNIKS